MKITNYKLPDWCIYPLVTGSLFLGATIGAISSSYDKLKLEQAGIEFKKGEVSLNRKFDTMPEHKFPTAGIFLAGKKTPYITHIYENEEKRKVHEPAMTFISSMDNGMNDVKIINENKCKACHKTAIHKYNHYKDNVNI